MSQPNPAIQPVGEQISVAAQLSPEQIDQLTQEGFKSVVNLRSYQEEGAAEEDQQRVEALGLAYANMPIGSLRHGRVIAHRCAASVDKASSASPQRPTYRLALEIYRSSNA